MADQIDDQGRPVCDMCERDCDLMEAGAIALEEALKGSAELLARIEQLEKEAQLLRGADARASMYLSIAADRLEAGAAYEGGHFDCDYEHPIHERITEICRDNARLTAENAGLQSELQTARNARNSLYAENAGLREDAARLDWLDERHGHGGKLRAEIDAARGAKLLASEGVRMSERERLLLEAVRWAMGQPAMAVEDETGVVYDSESGFAVEIPPEFAPLIAEAVKEQSNE